ncbi:MAG: class I SAM-dependent methyltransferase [Pseudomonadota bacterium]
MNTLNDKRVIDSWSKNTDPWTAAVRSGEIESRRLVTNQAIVDAVRSYSPGSAIDIGCGEGWLVRALAGIDMIGVDVVPGLIEQASTAGGGDFRVMSYEQIAANALEVTVDVAICNFSLIGKESVEGVFAASASFLKPAGKLIVQTLHPLMACGDVPYRDGWREGSWVGFSTDFTDPPPWFFRTIESWIALYAQNGFRLLEMREPIHPMTGKPVSIILVGETIYSPE